MPPLVHLPLQTPSPSKLRRGLGLAVVSTRDLGSGDLGTSDRALLASSANSGANDCADFAVPRSPHASRPRGRESGSDRCGCARSRGLACMGLALRRQVSTRQLAVLAYGLRPCVARGSFDHPADPWSSGRTTRSSPRSAGACAPHRPRTNAAPRQRPSAQSRRQPHIRAACSAMNPLRSHWNQAYYHHEVNFV